MSLRKTIYDAWAGYPPLLSLVPIGQVSTGKRFRDPTDPFVVIQTPYTNTFGRTSSGDKQVSYQVSFLIVSSDVDAIERIARAIESRFDRTKFSAPGDGECLVLQETGSVERQSGDGIWERKVSYEATINRPIGALD